MNVKNLVSTVKILSAVTITAGAAGTSAINSSIIDTKGFRGLCFVVMVGAVVAGAVTSFKVQHGDDSGLSDAADVATTNQTIADTGDDLVKYVDMGTLRKRYYRLVFSRATQNATVAAVALLYSATDAPVTQVAVGEALNNPIAGTA